MELKLDPIIIVPVELWGPSQLGTLTIIRCGVDTGANLTLIDENILVTLGYTTSSFPPIEITTADNIIKVPKITLEKIRVDKIEHEKFAVGSFTPPENLKIQGLIGLDFMKGHRFSVDFSKGTVCFE